MTDPDRPDFPGVTMSEIREALGHKTAAPDAEQPIEAGQTYRPTEHNKARSPEDRITVTEVYLGEGLDEQTIAYDIASTDHRGRPAKSSSALRESVFRKCYALDTPEPDSESPAETLARAVALLDSLDTVAYVIATPDTDGALDVNASARGVDARDASSAFRAAARGLLGQLRMDLPAFLVREFGKSSRAAFLDRMLVEGQPVSGEVREGTARPCAPGCTCRRASVEVTGTTDPAAAARAIEEALAPLRAAVSNTREQQRAKAKAQVLREVADGLEDRNGRCGIGDGCERCSARAAEVLRLRAAATELETAARPAGCTCGVPTDPTAVHRTDAPCYVKDTDQ
ncbi:hypothetical protein ACWGN5_07585 [Streptomyces sp. NPDC055815]